eukprot:jgi/Tetstr1/420926/TSEL_011987.t1
MGVTSSASGAVVGSKPSAAADAPATGVFNRAEAHGRAVTHGTVDHSEDRKDREDQSAAPQQGRLPPEMAEQY